MKSIFTIITLLIFGSTNLLHAQDTLLLKDKSKIACKVLEVRLNSVDYKNWADNSDVTFNINKSQLYLIIYNDGHIDTINLMEQSSLPTASTNAADTVKKDTSRGYEQGFQDGFNEYSDRRAVSNGIAAGLIVPLAGIAVPIVYTASKIKPEKLANTKYTQSQYTDSYKAGYRDGASKRRRNQGWNGYLGGLGIRTALTVIVVVALLGA